MTKATISSEGQIAIPKALRERLKLEAGAEVALEIQDERLVIQRVEPGIPHWRTMRGMLRNGSSLTQALEEEHREELARENQRLSRL
jgi:AbrB family looped-hinge helix DNA binding protein